MNSPSTPLRRRNHYVPVSYLANFTREGTREGRVFAYSRRAPLLPKSLALTTVGLERNLYIRDGGHGPDDEMERHLATSVEGPFSAVLDRLVRGARLGFFASAGVLSRSDRAAVARFLAYQMLRTPVERDAVRWLGELSALREVRENLRPTADLRRSIERAMGAALTAEQEESWVEGLAGLSVLRSRVEDWIPPTRRNADRFAPVFESMEWRIIRVPPPIELVTCDMPLVLARRVHGPGTYELGGGIGEPGFEATMALSPRYFLLVTRQVEDDASLYTEEFAQSVIDRTIRHAYRFVFSRSDDERVGQALAASPQPSHFIAFAGRVFRVGHPPVEIEREIRRSGIDTIEFRYGVPDDARGAR